MINLFENIEEKDKSKLIKNLESSNISLFKGNFLSYKVSTDTISKSLLILRKGKLEISKTNKDGDKIIIEKIKEGEAFGYMLSFISEDADIIAEKDSVIDIIEVERLLFLKESSLAYTIFLKNLFLYTSRKINEKNMHIDILSSRGIRNKLLTYFDYQYKIIQEKSFKLNSSITDLSEILAVDRSALSREIKVLKDEGILLYENRKVTLLYKA